MGHKHIVSPHFVLYRQRHISFCSVGHFRTPLSIIVMSHLLITYVRYSLPLWNFVVDTASGGERLLITDNISFNGLKKRRYKCASLVVVEKL